MADAVLSFELVWPLSLLAAIPLIAWLGYRSRTQLGMRHRLLATSLRTLTFVLVLLALMRPVWHAAIRGISVVYVLDVSGSVAPRFVGSALEWIRDANRKHVPESARYVAFSQRPILFSDLEEFERVARAKPPELLTDGTNLQLALDEALLGLDPDRIDRLVLMTDGNATRGDVWQVLPRLLAQHVRVYAFPALPREARDAWVESIHIPERPRRDEPLALTVRVMSMNAEPALVRLWHSAGELGRRRVQLYPGMNDLVFDARLRQSGVVDIAAEVTAEGDGLPENDRLTLSTWVEPSAGVLYLEADDHGGRYLKDALTREGFQLAFVAPAQMPVDQSLLSHYQAVILSDVPRASLGEQHMRALRNYVRDGGGLIYVAGETAYGEAGFAGTVLEQLLPVEFKAPEPRKDLALVVCLDRSYSMKGRSIELAKAATRAALAVLQEQHQFGVVAFDSRPHETVPLQRVGNRHDAETLIDRIQAGGQTNIYPALAIAFHWLEGAGAALRHVILLSDGDTVPADFEGLLGRMTTANISVSTVAVGDGADRELMASIARWGKGHAYYAEDPDAVPQIFLEDTLGASRSALVEEPVHAVVRRRVEMLQGLDFSAAPPLRGLAGTRARRDSEVLLATGSGAPLLVRWQYGLGRAVVFASDAKNRWGADWLRWDGYGKFWAQMTRYVVRQTGDESLRFRVTREGDGAQITLDAMSADGNWRTDLHPAVRVRKPAGYEETLTLRQSSPGRYVADIGLGDPSPRPFGFALQGQGGIGADAAARIGTRRLYYTYADEYRTAPPNVSLLRKLTEMTGGTLAPETAKVFDPGNDRGRTRRTLWPLMAGAALTAYLLEVALRRVPWLRRRLDRA